MSLLYRALWTDGDPGLIEHGQGVFEDWIHSKSIEIEVVRNETRQSEDESTELSAAFIQDQGVEALRIRLSEEKPARAGHGERWSTTVHWIRTEYEGWIWVDTEWVSDDVFAQRPAVAAPRLVGQLLDSQHAQLGENPLRDKPRTVKSDDVESLVEWIGSPSRDVPVVIFSVDTSLTPAEYSERAKKTAARLVGCVDVRLLTADSQASFEDELGDLNMAVFGGGARVYLPGADLENPAPWRHRYIPGPRLNAKGAAAAAQIASLVLPRMVGRRPPEVYRTHVKQLLDASTGDQTDWMAEALDLDRQLGEVQVLVERLRDERDLAVLEASDSERDAYDAMRRLDALRRSARESGQSPEEIELADDSPSKPPETCAAAVERAQQLANLRIPEEALRDIERLDESQDAELWAQRILNHLEALNAYGAEKGPGFKIWCETSGSPRAISTKFVAGDESDTVKTDPRLRAARRFPVDKEIDPAGVVEMFAHLKPVQGGGMQVPRIYFHDDTKGSTGLVHVGFIGPHDLVPNTRSN